MVCYSQTQLDNSTSQEIEHKEERALNEQYLQNETTKICGEAVSDLSFQVLDSFSFTRSLFCFSLLLIGPPADLHF